MSIENLLNSNGTVMTKEQIGGIVSGTTIPNKVFFDSRTGLGVVDIAERMQSEARNILDTGADPTGVADSKPAFDSIISNIPNGHNIIIPPGTYKISSNLTIPSNINLWFSGGAKLAIDNTIVVTINGKLYAPIQPIFQSPHSTAVVFGNDSTCDIHPEWYDLYVNENTDFSVAISRAILACGANQRVLLTRVYGLGTNGWTGLSIVGRDDVTIQGVGNGGFKGLFVPTQQITSFSGENPLIRTDDCNRLKFIDISWDTNQLDVWPLSTRRSNDTVIDGMVHTNAIFGSSTPRSFFDSGSDNINIRNSKFVGNTSLSRTATVTSTGSRTLLNDTAADFVALGVTRGMVVKNITDFSYGVVDVVATTSLTLQGVGLINGLSNGFNIGNTYNVIGPGGGAGLFLGSTAPGVASKNVRVTNNKLENCRTPIGGAYIGGVISNNEIFNCTEAGIVASASRADGGDNVEGEQVTVTGNKIEVTQGHGIQADVVSGKQFNLAITGNHIKWPQASGINIVDLHHGAVTGNVIVNANADGVGNDSGIIISGASEVAVTGNTIVDTRATPLLVLGINVIGLSAAVPPNAHLTENVTIVGNTVKNVSGDGIRCFSANLTGIKNITIGCNTIDGASIGIAILDNGTPANLEEIGIYGNMITNTVNGDVRLQGQKIYYGNNNWKTSAFQNLTRVITDGDTTPDLTGESDFELDQTSPTTISAFDGGELGREKRLTFIDALTTITHGGALRLAGSVSLVTPAANSQLVVVKKSDSSGVYWQEVSRTIA